MHIVVIRLRGHRPSFRRKCHGYTSHIARASLDILHHIVYSLELEHATMSLEAETALP